MLTPDQVYRYIRYEAEDRDGAVAFARATTREVAEHFGVDTKTAWKALNAAAKRGLVSKAGRVPLRGGYFQGRQQTVGWQLWEVYYEPEAVPNRRETYASNRGGYYVWSLSGSTPLTSEGPWGPYETLESAKTFARIGATEGAHDRAVSIGRDPTAAGFRIIRRYRRGTGERAL